MQLLPVMIARGKKELPAMAIQRPGQPQGGIACVVWGGHGHLDQE
jgi:hypothetical protein